MCVWLDNYGVHVAFVECFSDPLDKPGLKSFDVPTWCSVSFSGFCPMSYIQFSGFLSTPNEYPLSFAKVLSIFSGFLSIFTKKMKSIH